MTDIYDAHVGELVRNTAIRADPEVLALSYAILKEKQRILDEETATRTMSMIDTLPEWILDVLAIELRTPAYSEGYDIEVKRKLIKGTLEFYAHMGTPWAVNWAVETIFGNGSISEWFDYGGEPHHFRVSARNDGTFRSLEGLMDFLRMIQKVKRLSSWLDSINVVTDMGSQDLRIGGTFIAEIRIGLPELALGMIGSTLHFGGAFNRVARVPVIQQPDEYLFKRDMPIVGHGQIEYRRDMVQIPDSYQFVSGPAGVGNKQSIVTVIPLDEL